MTTTAGGTGAGRTAARAVTGLQIAKKDGRAQTGLTRTAGCCWPTAGTLMIDRTGGARPGQTTWAFGPNCGDAKRNGKSASWPACPQ